MEEEVELDFEAAEALLAQFEKGDTSPIIETPEAPEKALTYSWQQYDLTNYTFQTGSSQTSATFRVVSAKAIKAPLVMPYSDPTWYVPVGELERINNKPLLAATKTWLKAKHKDTYLLLTLKGVRFIKSDTRDLPPRYIPIDTAIFLDSIEKEEQFLALIAEQEIKSAELEEQARLKKVEEQRLKELAEMEALRPRIDEISAACELIFPGNWELAKLTDAEFKPSSNCVYRVTLHFPEFVIRNSRGTHRTITNLYVQFYFNKTMQHEANWFGNRGTVSVPEARANYKHSHLSSGSDWGNFCLGSDTEIQRVNGDLLLKKYDIALFTKALLLTLGYVEWESLEGGPYQKMADIPNKAGSGSLPNMPSESRVTEIYNSFSASLKLPLKLENNKLVIKDNDELNTAMLGAISSDYHVLQLPNGSLLSLGSDTSRQGEFISSFNRDKRNYKPIVFKNVTSYTECVAAEIKDKDESKKVVLPELKMRLLQKAEEEINMYYLNSITKV